MLYLLDADSIITGDKNAYPFGRFRIFWEWLAHMGSIGSVKIPAEQYEEVISGRGEIVDWLKLPETRTALLLQEEAIPRIVADVTLRGYGDLNEDEIEQVGRDPFLISYAVVDPNGRTVVSFETSAPSKQRANRKIPDVCRMFGVACVTLFEMVSALDFTTEWRPPD